MAWHSRGLHLRSPQTIEVKRQSSQPEFLEFSRFLTGNGTGRQVVIQKKEALMRIF
jgi:hypothetical protein